MPLIFQPDIPLEVLRQSFSMMQVTSILSFAASCSAGGVVVLFDKDAYFCSRDPHLPCGTFELATAFAFLSWALSATSALVMFWLLASS